MRSVNIPLYSGGGRNNPKIIVVHSMGEFIGPVKSKYFYAIDWLAKLGLSAHAFATPSGVIIKSFSPEFIAWHAKAFNTGSLGIEFLVPGVHLIESFKKAIDSEYVSAEQFSAGIDWVVAMLNRYDIQKVTRHSDLDPERKVDPGKGFPWEDFLHTLGVDSDGKV